MKNNPNYCHGPQSDESVKADMDYTREDEMSRPYTKKECQEKFINQIKGIAQYWAKQEPNNSLNACEGVAFSILVMLDGGSMGMPAIDLSLAPHPDDMEFHISERTNYFELDMIFNDDCQLHELLVQKEEPK